MAHSMARCVVGQGTRVMCRTNCIGAHSAMDMTKIVWPGKSTRRAVRAQIAPTSEMPAMATATLQ